MAGTLVRPGTRRPTTRSHHCRCSSHSIALGRRRSLSSTRAQDLAQRRSTTHHCDSAESGVDHASPRTHAAALIKRRHPRIPTRPRPAPIRRPSAANCRHPLSCSPRDDRYTPASRDRTEAQLCRPRQVRIPSPRQPACRPPATRAPAIRSGSRSSLVIPIRHEHAPLMLALKYAGLDATIHVTGANSNLPAESSRL